MTGAGKQKNSIGFVTGGGNLTEEPRGEVATRTSPRETLFSPELLRGFWLPGQLWSRCGDLGCLVTSFGVISTQRMEILCWNNVVVAR
jgi:hypothetical protein